ncbi:MAG: hypothetical protein GY835_08695 [bacterium]|nr:hypothetical protein [bacterium]
MSASNDSSLPHFNREFFKGEHDFTCLGTGKIGGKAAGLDKVRRQIVKKIDLSDFPDLEINVPTMTVLSTTLFDLFMERNELYELALSDLPDDRIAHAFQKGSFPAEFVGDIYALIAEVTTPLAVRSSSLLEDALNHPFAGVYGTKMTPNNQPDTEKRFRKLIEAIKFVYASTFFRGAKNYLRSVGQDHSQEKMAVIIQEVVGSRHDDRFYPCISGVARSYNYYATGHAKPEDGVINLALGLGRQIVDGGLSWTYTPTYPKSPAPFSNIGDILKNTQTTFWAVNMGKPPLLDPVKETEYLLNPDIPTAEMDGVLTQLVSTYDYQSDRMRQGMASEGPRVLDFAPILRSGVVSLNNALRNLLAMTEAMEKVAVEIEFAVNLTGLPDKPARFGFLQARPMMVSDDTIDLAEEELCGDNVLVASEQVLGNGADTNLCDVVYLKPDLFEACHTPVIARELEQVNKALVDSGRECLLIGFGRWGSSDPWLGVPVDWAQISQARTIVEATLPDMITDMSQGSHFFHNMLSFKVKYMSVKYSGPYHINWDWLTRQTIVNETNFVCHVRLASPLEIKVDGRSGKGVIRHA